MTHYAQQAITALVVYLERGRDALNCLGGGDLDQAGELLRGRAAAFHNFRSIDALALQNGLDIGELPEARSLWEEIQQVDRQLETALKAAQEDANKLYLRVRRARQKIGNYRSKSLDTSRFEQSV